MIESLALQNDPKMIIMMKSSSGNLAQILIRRRSNPDFNLIRPNPDIVSSWTRSDLGLRSWEFVKFVANFELLPRETTIWADSCNFYRFLMIFMICWDFYDAKNNWFEIVSSSKGTPFLKIPALPGNREKSSYRVSVSLPGVGKIPVARWGGARGSGSGFSWILGKKQIKNN